MVMTKITEDSRDQESVMRSVFLRSLPVVSVATKDGTRNVCLYSYIGVHSFIHESDKMDKMSLLDLVRTSIIP